MKIKTTLAALALSVGLTSPARAGKVGDKCSGNACRDVSFKWDGCYRIRNHGERRVRVHMGPWSFIVQRGQTHTLRIGNVCVQSFVGEVKANYAE